jgi:histidyl-tRNA synthetase
MQTADRAGCDIAFIIGEAEKNKREVSVKFMRIEDAESKETSVSMDLLSSFAQHHSTII